MFTENPNQSKDSVFFFFFHVYTGKQSFSTILQFHVAGAFVQSDVQHKYELRQKGKP